MCSSGPRRGHFRSQDWVPLSRGLYLPASEAADPLARLAAWVLVLPPSGCFTHVTAAAVYGWRLPALPDDTPVFAAMHEGESRPRRTGLRVARHPQPPARLVRSGLPVADPVDALLAAAQDLGLLDLGILVDSAFGRGACRPAELLTATSGRRGGPALRKAVGYADARAESAWETLLRIFHVVCEVPVVPQLELRTDAGRFVARADLWIEGTKVLHEYDGAVHRDREQHRRDLARERRIGAMGWVRRGYTAVDLLRDPQAILREADAALGRPHDPGRLQAWHVLLTESTLTASGRARLRRRWKLPETR